MWSRIWGTCTRTAIACFVCLYSYRHTLNDDDDVRGDCDNDVHADIVEVEVVTSVAFSSDFAAATGGIDDEVELEVGAFDEITFGRGALTMVRAERAPRSR